MVSQVISRRGGVAARAWPDASPAPLIVFATAYDQYALAAFDHAAVDYLLKPIDANRLAQTCARVQAALAAQREAPAGAPPAWDAALGQLRDLLATPGLANPGAAAPQRLHVIQAGVGNAIHLVPVDDVVYFEAADKYVRVVTEAREHLIRVALRDLLPQLDPQRFWQIHRGTVVRADAIAVAERDESGKLTLTLRGRAERLTVSRLYAHRFKAM